MEVWRHLGEDPTTTSHVTSQDHPVYTQLIRRSSIKIYIIDSQKLNYLKNKAIAFGRNSHLLVSNPLLPAILICFAPSESNPLFSMQRPS